MSDPGEVDVARAYRTYFPTLLRKCQRVLGNTADAQDVAQDTFVRLWRSRADLRDTDRVIGWLYTTSTRLAVDRLRARRPDGPEPSELVGPAEQVPERVAEARALLRKVVEVLDAEELELLVLSRLDGLRQQEIAELLGTSERTVRRRLSELTEHIERVGAEHG